MVCVVGCRVVTIIAVEDPTLQTMTHGFDDHFNNLRTATLRLVLPIAGVLGYLWLIWVLWPIRSQPTPLAAWAGSVALLIVSVVGLLEFQNCPKTIAIGLIASAVVAAACAVPSFGTVDTVFMLVVPIILSGAMFGPRVVIAVGILVSIFSLLLVQVNPVAFLAPLSAPLMFGLVVLISISSSRSLRVLLEWALIEQQHATRNESLARDRQAELAQALRSLDTVTYNLERTNYLLGQARSRAEEAWRLKQQFAQNISHELRTPLNLVVGFAENMIQSPEYYGSQLPPAYLRDLTIVYRNASHLQNLVNDVLDLARIESAQMGLVTEKTDIADLLSDTMSIMRKHIERRGLEVCVDVAEDLPKVDADPLRIRQVVLNLLNNALRFTERGTITLRAVHEHDGIVISVIDTGIGIPSAELGKIFEAFHQVDNSRQRRQGGAGLGLTISKRFVEMHGGHIWVESEVGEGSAFHFRLPVEAAHSREMPRIPEVAASRIPSRWSRERVMLIITGSPAAATMLTRYIRDCRPVFIDNLEEARLVAQQSVPQLVLIDTLSVTLSAEQVIGLADSWGMSNVPFIACGLPGETRTRQYLATSGYLVKPISRDTLRDVLIRLGDSVSKVLVIDDDQDFVRLISRMLDHPVRRYRVMNAYSGREGFEMALRYQPDAILMDLGLPDIDGLTLLDQIRASPITKQIPIIIVSAYDEPDATSHIPGAMIVHRPSGFLSGEIVQWIQKILDTITQTAT